MFLKLVHRVPIFRHSIKPLIDRWVAAKISDFQGKIPESSSIIDIGAGNCLVASQLLDQGHHVQPVDVKNLSVLSHLSAKVYDGHTLPYDNKSFDVALLLTVLHHCDTPEKVMKEASRVASKIVIIEDTFTTKFQKWYTQATDTLVNFGHSKMTYQNKSAEEWITIATNFGLSLRSVKHKRVLLVFQQTIFEFE